MMVFVNLLPIGALQLYDSFANGYWHAREPELLPAAAGARSSSGSACRATCCSSRRHSAGRLPGAADVPGGARDAQLPPETETEEFTQVYEGD